MKPVKKQNKCRNRNRILDIAMTVFLDKLYSLLIENTEALYIALHFLGMS